MDRLRIGLQIQNRLLHLKLWRLLGLFSSFVGFLSYAVSSTFHQLFGQWSSLKLIIYCVVSLSITSLFLFSQKLRLSRSMLIKIHLGFLFLILTTFYSFFYDKSIKGKPDLFSFISCASFALMSLSLSKFTNLGFEGDLLNFFLGCLIVQLMKLHLVLGFIAAIFCYFIIVLRHRPRPSHDHQSHTGHIIGAQDHQFPVAQIEMEIDGTVREMNHDSSSDNPLLTLQTRFDDHDDGYNWKRYEAKHVRGSEKQVSFYKCSIPNCPVRKRVERNGNEQVCEVVYKGTHNHGMHWLTMKRNSSFEALYANQPLKAFFFDENPYQQLQTCDNEELDRGDSPEHSSVSC